MDKLLADLNTRHNCNYSLSPDEVKSLLLSVYFPEQVNIIADFSGDRNIKELVTVYHLAESRIRNLYYSAIDKVFTILQSR